MLTVAGADQREICGDQLTWSVRQADGRGRIGRLASFIMRAAAVGPCRRLEIRSWIDQGS
jgi:hypothetical protein